MTAPNRMTVRRYMPDDKETVIELWRKCGLVKPWNNPELDIERKLKVNPELFLVGHIENRVIATVMGGYDGHRGWVYYLAVEPDYQKTGLGRRMMTAIEDKLLESGCPKINLQVRSDKSDVIGFYNKIGYEAEDRISIGKRLVSDEER